MKQSDIPWERIHDNRRRAHYITRAGWPVFPDEVLPGAVIYPEEVSRLPSDKLLVRPHATEQGDNVESCDFCNDTTSVAERGMIPADYELVRRWRLSETVAHSCHACISEMRAIEYDVDTFDPDEIFRVKDH